MAHMCECEWNDLLSLCVSFATDWQPVFVELQKIMYGWIDNGIHTGL